MKLDRRWVDQIPEGLKHGQQIKVNHNNCPAGTDTKERLYIKKDGHTILAYCHNCSGYGVTKRKQSSFTFPRAATLEKELLPEPPPIRTPTLYTTELVNSACSWMDKYLPYYDEHSTFPYAVVVRNHNVYLTQEGVVLRIDDGQHSFWQKRIAFPDMPPPVPRNKYYTGKNQTRAPVLVKSPAPNTQITCVITEDILSALCVAATGLADAIPLCGTDTPCFGVLVEKLKPYKHAVVWLDDDDAGRKGANLLEKRLQLVRPGKAEVMRFYKEEPKLDKTIKTVLEYANRGGRI